MRKETVKQIEKKFTTSRGTIGPNDWFMKEFSRDTNDYFK